MSFNQDIYLWRVSDSYPNKFIGTYDKEKNPDYFCFRKAQRIDDNSLMPIINFPEASIDELKNYNVLVCDTLLPIVNREMLSILEEQGSDCFQIFDAKITANDGVLGGYYLINILNEVDGVDIEQSDVKYLPGTKHVMTYNHVVYKLGCLEGINIARNSKFHSHLIITEFLKNRIMTLKNTSLDLVKVS